MFLCRGCPVVFAILLRVLPPFGMNGSCSRYPYNAPHCDRYANLTHGSLPFVMPSNLTRRREQERCQGVLERSTDRLKPRKALSCLNICNDATNQKNEGRERQKKPA